MKILVCILVILVSLSACAPGVQQSVSNSSTSPPVVQTPDISLSSEVASSSSQAASPSPQPVDQDLASLITRKAQDYIQTKEFEGFTNTNTYQDVCESYSKKGITPCEVSVIYSVDLVGFPANMHCHFNPLLEGLTFYIVYEPGLKDYETQFNAFLTNMSDALGSNYIKRDLGGNDGNGYEYVWQYGEYSIGVGTKEAFYQSTGELAEIFFFDDTHAFLPKSIPDIFHYQYGADFNTINTTETESMTKEYVVHAASLSYKVDNVIIEYDFSQNPTLKDVTFNRGSYRFSSDTPLNKDDVVDIMEKTANSLQKILGKTESKEYIVSEDESFDTAEEMKKIDCDEFELSMEWGEIWLLMNYNKNQGISALFYPF